MRLITWSMYLQLFKMILVFLLPFGAIAILGFLWRKLWSKVSGKGQSHRVPSKTYKVKLAKRDNGTYSIQQVDRMTGEEFELFVEKLFRVLEKDRILKTELTASTGDQGCDVIVKYQDGNILGIQCKRWAQKVDNKAVQNIVTAKAIYGLTLLMVFTNSFYTKSAQEAARLNHVELVDRSHLIRMIKRYNDTIRELHAKT